MEICVYRFHCAYNRINLADLYLSAAEGLDRGYSEGESKEISAERKETLSRAGARLLFLWPKMAEWSGVSFSKSIFKRLIFAFFTIYTVQKAAFLL